jgi:hypothetical protein
MNGWKSPVINSPSHHLSTEIMCDTCEWDAKLQHRNETEFLPKFKVQTGKWVNRTKAKFKKESKEKGPQEPDIET